MLNCHFVTWYVAGGLAAVVYTETVQTCFMIIGGSVLSIYGKNSEHHSTLHTNNGSLANSCKTELDPIFKCSSFISIYLHSAL